MVIRGLQSRIIIFPTFYRSLPIPLTTCSQNCYIHQPQPLPQQTSNTSLRCALTPTPATATTQSAQVLLINANKISRLRRGFTLSMCFREPVDFYPSSPYTSDRGINTQNSHSHNISSTRPLSAPTLTKATSQSAQALTMHGHESKPHLHVSYPQLPRLLVQHIRHLTVISKCCLGHENAVYGRLSNAQLKLWHQHLVGDGIIKEFEFEFKFEFSYSHTLRGYKWPRPQSLLPNLAKALISASGEGYCSS
jgi:hypothetical protein